MEQNDNLTKQFHPIDALLQRLEELKQKYDTFWDLMIIQDTWEQKSYFIQHLTEISNQMHYLYCYLDELQTYLKQEKRDLKDISETAIQCMDELSNMLMKILNSKAGKWIPDKIYKDAAELVNSYQREVSHGL